ncbi:hypothetical protein T06_1992 [Trichinella sp. T6]|nr:hypothetical protein T06_1992 [Trichinella sp. T6]
MADNLHLVSNERDHYNLIHEGRVYNLKRTNMEDKQLKKDKGVQSTRTWMWTQSWIKKNALKRRAAEELKTILQIYHDEACISSADLETVGQFSTYKSVKSVKSVCDVQKTCIKISKTSAQSPVAGDSTTLRMI